MGDRRHTSTHYEKELQELKDGLLYLGGLAENAIKNALQALVERNSELARRVIADDAAIDQLDSENEDRCIRILALRQPAARDRASSPRPSKSTDIWNGSETWRSTLREGPSSQ
jgi:phosphate transport system protein